MGNAVKQDFTASGGARVQERRTSIPPRATRLIGRQREVASVQELLRIPEIRLVTLTGAPGVGKTRLAVEIAANLDLAFQHGVPFVDLAPTRDPAVVASRLAEELGVKEAQGRSPLEAAKRFLADRHTLLILDNFEHVAAVGTQVAELLGACPLVKIVVTSRVPLQVNWEQEFPVAPLEIPSLQPLPSLEALVSVPAVALFIERARAVRPDFTLLPANCKPVAEICSRLDGIPLAIELAAARVKLLAPEQIAARLGDPTLLTALHKAIDLSYQALKPPERLLFMQLSVFLGGFTLEAVDNVCRRKGKDSPLSLLATLVNHSLVTVGVGEHEARYRLLEPIREYAWQHVTEVGEDALLRQRHAQYFLDIAERAAERLTGPDQQAAVERLATEHDNVRSALSWAVTADPGLALQAAGALAAFWEMRGHWSEGREYLDAALRNSVQRTSARARALLGAGTLASNQADYAAALRLYDESLNLYSELNDPAGEGNAFNRLGLVSWKRGEHREAQELLERSLSRHQQIDNRAGMAATLNSLGIVTSEQADYEAAHRAYVQALAMHSQLHNLRGQAMVLNNLGTLHQMQKHLAQARAFYEESLKLQRRLGNRRGIAIAVVNVGHVARLQSDTEAARKAYSEGLQIQRDLGDPRDVAELLEGVAQLLQLGASHAESATLLAAASAFRKTIGAPAVPQSREALNSTTDVNQSALGRAGFETASAKGQTMTSDEAIEYAQIALDPPNIEQSPSQDAANPLSRREREVALLIAQGLINREIAKALYITEGTAANHIQHIMNKLKVNTRAQIAAWVVKHKLLESS